MEEIICKYIENMKQKKMSSNTLDAYERDLVRFDDFITEKNEKLVDVDAITVMAFVQELKKLGKANSTITRNIVSLRNFYKYLIKSGIKDDNPAELYEMPKVTQNIPKVLTVEEVDKLLNTPDLSCNKGIRDKAMLEIMYAAGLKVSELLKLTVFDVNIKFSYIRCIGSKNRERIIPIGSYGCRCIEEYLKIRSDINHSNSSFLFLNMHGSEMTRQGFWKIIRGYAEEANIEKTINTFTLRHSCAVHMLQNGADLKLIQELLGHQGIAATQIYLNMSKKNRLSEVYKATHPRA